MTVGDNRFRPSPSPQPWDRIARHLAAAGLRLDPDVTPRQFAGGLANLNYLVSVDGEPAVFRRPPPGPSAEGANDLQREHTVLASLAPAFPLAPRALHLCEDTDVLGAPFLLLEYRDGHAIGGRLPDCLAAAPGVGRTLTDTLVAAIADLHRVEPSAIGLGELGRPAGFLGRQVEGWARRAEAVFPDGVPASVTAIVAALRASAMPPEHWVSLLHCDAKFDNLLVDLEHLTPVAFIDWDMATRGDPLFDVAVLLSYWIEPTDPPGVHGLEQVPSLEPGFPGRDEVASRYFEAVDRPPADMTFHLMLARLRLGIAWMQLYRLFERGSVEDQRYATFEATAMAVLEWTAQTRPRRPSRTRST
jgi:aminoglycoside phosphotransferase (APT) family kinase protein